MSILIGTWLMGRTKWGKTPGTGGDLIIWAEWKWRAPQLISDKAMRDWKIASCTFFLQFHFIEIRYISANVCLPLWLSLPLQWTVAPTLVSVHGAYMSFQMQTNRLTHTDVDTRTHREGSFFSQLMFSSSIMALWYSAILQLLKSLCWTSRRRVGKHTPHKHRSTDCDWPGWFGCRGSGAIVSSTVSELSSAVVAIDMAGTDRGILRPQPFSASVKCSLKWPETLTYEKWHGSV